MDLPTTWQFFVLAAAAFRLTRLVIKDTITEDIRERICGRTDDGQMLPKYHYRPKLDELLHCPWCIGFWVGLLTAVAWWADDGVTLAVSLPLALSAVTGLVAARLDDD
jgi:hypothetical protein